MPNSDHWLYVRTRSNERMQRLGPDAQHSLHLAAGVAERVQRMFPDYSIAVYRGRTRLWGVSAGLPMAPSVRELRQ